MVRIDRLEFSLFIYHIFQNIRSIVQLRINIEKTCSLLSAGGRIYTVGSDCGQMSLYEEHDFNFITAVFQICHAYVECSGEIYSINVFDIFSSLAAISCRIPSYLFLCQLTSPIVYLSSRTFVSSLQRFL